MASNSDRNPESSKAGRQPLKIWVLNVGQGDSTLILGPSGKTILIDAGAAGQGNQTVLPMLGALNLHQLNWIIASHYDADHIGGIPEVLRGPDQSMGTEDDLTPLNDLLDRGDFTDKKAQAYTHYLEAATPYRHEAIPGMTLNLGDGAMAEVVVVNGRYSDGTSIHLNPDEENEAAIGLLIHYGTFKYFTAGDLTGGGAPGGFETKDMETQAGAIIGAVSVLHVGHHGSSSSTNETFLEEVKPEAAVISVGRDNLYGHPTRTVLKRLEASGASVYRTDQMGTLEIQTDGNEYEISYQ